MDRVRSLVIKNPILFALGWIVWPLLLGIVAVACRDCGGGKTDVLEDRTERIRGQRDEVTTQIQDVERTIVPLRKEAESVKKKLKATVPQRVDVTDEEIADRFNASGY